MSFFSHYDDERDPYEEDRQMNEDGVTCKRCGQDGLIWVNTGLNRQRLVEDGGKFHFCKPTADDFDDLTVT